MNDATAGLAVFTGAVGLGGTIVGGPILRLARWADWKTSFLDAMNVSFASGLLATAYWHLALRDDTFALGKIFHYSGRLDGPVKVTTGVAMLSVVIGYVMLRRHRVARSVGTALLVILAFLFAGFLFLVWTD